MSVKHTPGRSIVAPPGTVEINWTLTEDEFLLLMALIGKTRYSLLNDQYYETGDLRRELDPDRARSKAILAKSVPELAP